LWLVVGLGNPGSEYARTRHNLGFMVVDELAARAGAAAASGSVWKAKFGAELAEGKLSAGGHRLLLCKPMEFMNLSGQAVQKVAAFWKVAPAQTVVVHDELDLPFGRLKLGAGGGAGGHNGIRSLIGALGADFIRVRVGIGKPTSKQQGAGHVLGGFSKEEQAELPFIVAEAREAVEGIVAGGLVAAMNRFNQKKKNEADTK
jgi:peptidyl-tRNA hydrolase, PTH1 family